MGERQDDHGLSVHSESCSPVFDQLSEHLPAPGRGRWPLTWRMSRWGERVKKVEQLAQSFQHKPLSAPYRPRLWPCQPSSVWKLLPRQSPAIGFAQSCKEVTRHTGDTGLSHLSQFEPVVEVVFCLIRKNVSPRCTWLCFQAVHVFALEKEKSSQGQRIYLVTSYTELWHYYRWLVASLCKIRCIFFPVLGLDYDYVLIFLQDLPSVLDALLWGDSRGRRLQALLWLGVSQALKQRGWWENYGVFSNPGWVPSFNIYIPSVFTDQLVLHVDNYLVVYFMSYKAKGRVI